MYSKECHTYMKNNPRQTISKYQVAELTARPYLKALTAENLCSAFRKTGICPFNSKAVTDSQVAPSIIYPAQEDQHKDTSADKSKQDPQPTELTPPENNLPQTSHETKSNEQETKSASFFKDKTITCVIKSKPRCKFVPPFLAGNLLKKSITSILTEQSANKKSILTILKKTRKVFF